MDINQINEELNSIRQEQIDIDNGVQEQIEDFNRNYEDMMEHLAEMDRDRVLHEMGCF